MTQRPSWVPIIATWALMTTGAIAAAADNDVTQMSVIIMLFWIFLALVRIGDALHRIEKQK